ncbi:MAG: hypothetical protein V4543_13255 [Bacteroidota bacterium]
MKKLLLLTLGLTMTALTSVMAQDEPPNPPDEDGPTSIPVDGGASLLLIAGATYGHKKLKALRAKKAAAANPAR